ncbi:MAG: DUF3400 domain-containing protein, partial [Chromatiales bacterium]|nr:DUF3400 domain-containing protein [Chromatiales bacterium]
ELNKGIETINSRVEQPAEIKLLTSCPACQQGLSRYTDETGLKPRYLVLEVIQQRLGDQWQQQFIDQVSKDGIEMVLV